MAKLFSYQTIFLISFISSACFASFQVLNHRLLKPASKLSPGMQLVYSSNGKELPPWIIKKITTHNLSFNEWEQCAEIAVEYELNSLWMERAECLSENGFLMINEGDGWQQSRPIQENMELKKYSDEGDLIAEYKTGQFVTVVIDGVEYRALETEVLTYGAEGVVKTRLLEKYSIELSTAVAGVFYIPTRNHWNLVNEFKLAKIH